MFLVKKIKILPAKSQKETINFWLRKCCYLYNVALEERISYYRSTGKYLSAYDQKKELVEIKQYDKSWNDIPNKSLQEIIFRLDIAYKGFFNRGCEGFPKFKSECNSIYFIGNDVRIKDNKLFLPKIKTEIRYKEIIPENYTSCNLVKENNTYYLCFRYNTNTDNNTSNNRIGNNNFVYNKKTKFSTDLKNRINPENIKGLINNDNSDSLGIDLGLYSLYTDSNGNKQNRFSLKLVKKYNERIEVLNRSLSKKMKGSKRRKRVKKQLTKTYIRLKNTRNDFLHKAANKLLSNKENNIVIGDIDIQNIIDKTMNSSVKSKKQKKGLIKGFYSASLNKFKNYVEYKGILRNKNIIFINEAYTSKTCSCCGHIKEMKLSDRVYVCEYCGNSINRDENSAINMKLLGSSILLPVMDNNVVQYCQ